jgi:hypothetical protein
VKAYKVWIEVEEYDPSTDTYIKDHSEPLDIRVEDGLTAAIKLQTTLQMVGESIQAHYGKTK